MKRFTPANCSITSGQWESRGHRSGISTVNRVEHPPMMRRQSETSELRRIAESSETREVRARLIAELIRNTGSYRWVGIYDVTPHEIAAIAWSGGGDPAFPAISRDAGPEWRRRQFRKNSD